MSAGGASGYLYPDLATGWANVSYQGHASGMPAWVWCTASGLLLTLHHQPAGDALFQTHENLEHLAMMETVLGRIPESMAASANENARNYFMHRQVLRLTV